MSSGARTCLLIVTILAAGQASAREGMRPGRHLAESTAVSRQQHRALPALTPTRARARPAAPTSRPPIQVDTSDDDVGGGGS